MGQFEKIAVLLMGFFLVTVIIVVSFNSHDDKSFSMGPSEEVADGRGEKPATRPPEAPDPDSASLIVTEEQGLSIPDEDSSVPGSADIDDPQSRGLLVLRDEDKAAETEVQSPNLLLETAGSGGVRDGEVGVLPAGAALITLEGLTDTFQAELKEYSWQRGDTFVSVAEKLYGDQEKSALLRQFNEGITYVAPGQKILVPIFDGRRQRGEVVGGDTAETVADGSAADGHSYTVVDGDSLWVISKEVYGRGALWEKIFEANRDLLDGPDDIAVGMKLRIP
jgi:nucleoid-associated protein YgaU